MKYWNVNYLRTENHENYSQIDILSKLECLNTHDIQEM